MKTGTGRDRKDISKKIFGWAMVRWLGLLYRGEFIDKGGGELRMNRTVRKEESKGRRWLAY